MADGHDQWIRAAEELEDLVGRPQLKAQLWEKLETDLLLEQGPLEIRQGIQIIHDVRQTARAAVVDTPPSRAAE
jgi:hypothetical protein